MAYEGLTWQEGTLTSEPFISVLVRVFLPPPALITPPWLATFPRRQLTALVAPLLGAWLLDFFHPVVLLHGLSEEGRFSELSINRAIEWHPNNVESQLHCYLRPVASVIVSLAAARYYYPFIMGLGSTSLMTRVFIGTRVVFIWSHTPDGSVTHDVWVYGDHWS